MKYMAPKSIEFMCHVRGDNTYAYTLICTHDTQHIFHVLLYYLRHTCTDAYKSYIVYNFYTI